MNNKTYKDKASNNFEKIQKLPDKVSDLRKTINLGSNKNSKNTDDLSPLRKDNEYKREKYDKIDLRATINYGKPKFE